MASGRYRRLWCDWPSRACPLHSPGWSLCQKRRQAKQDHTANPGLKSRGCSNSWMLAENQSAKIRHHAVTSADSPLLANWIGFTIGTGGVSIESDIRRMTALLKAEITASSIVRRLPVVTPGLLIRLLFHITTRCRLRRVISCVALLR
jgi:hypothetical protein